MCTQPPGRQTADGDACVTLAAGIRWDERFSYCQNEPLAANQEVVNPTVTYRDYSCIYSLGECHNNMIVLYFVYFTLAIFLDNVWPNENGTCRPVWYCLMPGYWRPKRPVNQATVLRNLVAKVGAQAPGAGSSNQASRAPARRTSADDLEDDVKEEEDKMRALLAHKTAGEGGRATGCLSFPKLESTLLYACMETAIAWLVVVVCNGVGRWPSLFCQTYLWNWLY